MLEIAIAADYSIIIPTFLLIMNGKIKMPIHYQLIVSFILLLFVRNSLTFILGELGIFNMYIYNWCNLLGSFIINILYYNLFVLRYFKWIAVAGILASVVTTLFDYESLFNSSTTNFNRFSYISGCFIILFVLLYFYELLQNLQVPKLTKYPLFWFGSGTLIYYSGTVFSYLYVNYTFNNPNLSIVRSYWMIDALLFIVFSVFLALSVWYMKPTRVAK